MDASSPIAGGTQRQAFGYSGRASAYFRIWLVSLCLTLLTLGLYSPWAKVRKRRYLYRSIRLAGASFDYHADPLVILRGRLLAVGMLALYVFGEYVAPGLQALVGLVILAAAPWLVVRARMFNARNTSYRNLRFRFSPAYGEAYKVIGGYGLLAAVTGGLMYPYAQYRRSRLLVDNTHYANLRFALDDIGGAFYATYTKAWAAGLVAIVALLMSLLPSLPTAAPGTGELPFAAVVPAALVLAVIGLVFSYLGPAIAKLVIGNMSIGEHRVRCDWAIPRVMFIYMTNFIGIALTLGLAIPWATVRLQRYQFENLAVDVVGDLASIIAEQSEEVSAMGEELGDVFDIDIGL